MIKTTLNYSELSPLTECVVNYAARFSATVALLRLSSVSFLTRLLVLHVPSLHACDVCFLLWSIFYTVPLSRPYSICVIIRLLLSAVDANKDTDDKATFKIKCIPI